MKKIAFLVVTSSLFLAGCPKHEVIPAPTPKVDLKSRFVGEINGTDVEWTQNVDGYYLNPTKTKVINSGSTLSTAVYSSEMMSDTEGKADIRVSLGLLSWDATIEEDPTLAIFNSYFKSLTQKPMKAGADGGFEVVYTDATGKVRKSDPTRPNSPTYYLEFFQNSQVSDASGDYAKFKCSSTSAFYVYYRRPVVDTIVDSILINIGEFTGWFKR